MDGVANIVKHICVNSIHLLVRMLLSGDEVRLGQEARVLWHQHTKRAWRLAVITAAALHKGVLMTAIGHRKSNAGSCELC